MGMLFRPEALQFQQQNRQWGQVAPLQPLSTKVLSWFIAAAVALVLLFLFVGQYARKETVTGYLTPIFGTAKIFASQQGTIKEIYVKEGQKVEIGQPLLAVDTSRIAANGEDIDSSVLATLTSHRELLQHQIAAEQDRMKSEKERLNASIRSLQTEEAELRAQIAHQNETIRVSNALVTSVSGLRANGLISEPEYRRRELAALEQKQRLNALNQQLAAKHNQLTENRYNRHGRQDGELA
jgi:membrane fusion protein